MAKAELGAKRICPNCGAKYYDLNRSPIVCPRCGTHFEAQSRSRAQAAAPVDDDTELEDAAPEGAEFVTLEEADEEAAGGVADDEDEEAAGDDAPDPFLEEVDEEEDDVSGIIGGVEDGDEEA
ncbi:MAG: TIGR02300 family protein [Bauldia sp.]